METLIEQIQPYLVSIVTSIAGIIAMVVLALLASLRTKVSIWIDTRTSESQRELIHKIANEAFAHAESAFKSESSRNKLNQAFVYASERLGAIGIKVTPDEITAAIEKACLEHNADKVKALKNGDKAS